MIEYYNNVHTMTSDNLTGFFAGWASPPSSEKLYQLLAHSPHKIVAADSQTGNVVGFIYAISDGTLSAYIPLLEVLPAYRQRGIGSELLKRLLDELSGYYMVDLCCDAELAPFYSRFGMKPAVGMIRRNDSMQSGRD